MKSRETRARRRRIETGHRIWAMATALALATPTTLLSSIVLARGEDAGRQAEAYIRRGVDLRQAGNDDAAVVEFRKAYDLGRTPRAAAQLGLAEQAMGRWEDAESHVGESLLTPRDPWIAKHQDTLREALSNIKGHVGRVEVVGEPAGADVLVNGRLVGKTPLAESVHVRAGDVQVELRAAGYLRASRSTTVAGGQYQSMVIRLEKEGTVPRPATKTTAATNSAPAAAAASSAEGAAAKATTTSESAGAGATIVASDRDGAAPDHPARLHNVAKWTAVGLAVGALALGTTATFIRFNKRSAFDNSDPRCSEVNGQAVLESDPTKPVPACQSLLDEFHTARTLQIVGFASAGVFGLTALVLALTQPDSASTAESRSTTAALARPAGLFDWGCTVTASRPGLTCQARF